MLTKRTRQLNDTLKSYVDYLTRFAYEKLKYESQRFGDVEINESDKANESSKFVSIMQLPCRHIFKLLDIL